MSDHYYNDWERFAGEHPEWKEKKTYNDVEKISFGGRGSPDPSPTPTPTPSESDIFYITFTYDGLLPPPEEPDPDHPLACDKTFEEIKSAYENGKLLIGIPNGYSFDRFPPMIGKYYPGSEDPSDPYSEWFEFIYPYLPLTGGTDGQGISYSNFKNIAISVDESGFWIWGEAISVILYKT